MRYCSECGDGLYECEYFRKLCGHCAEQQRDVDASNFRSNLNKENNTIHATIPNGKICDNFLTQHRCTVIASDPTGLFIVYWESNHELSTGGC